MGSKGSSRRLAAMLSLLTLACLCATVATAGTRGRTLQFVVTFKAGGKAIAHPPAGCPNDETDVDLTLTRKGAVIGTGHEHTRNEPSCTTHLHFLFRFHDGALTFVGTIAATANGFVERFHVAGGTGAYRGAKGGGVIRSRSSGVPGFNVTINLS
jgi:hypothetical protein